MHLQRKSTLGGGVVVVLLLGHMSTALEVPLDSKILEGLPQPPTITHQSPKDYIIDPRENIVIQCEAKGKPHPSFFWTRNGSHFNVDKDQKITMRPNMGTLVIDTSGEKAEAYEGVYQCMARNDYGTAVSNNIVIRQSKSPLWSKERIEPITERVGMSLVLHCRPPAGLPPPVIFWMDNNFQKLPQNHRVAQALNGDLYFSNVLLDDSRNDYICYARFPYTQTIQQKQPITVTVLNGEFLSKASAADNHFSFVSDQPPVERKPSIMHPVGSNSTTKALKGEHLELECIADGLPTPEISWTKLNGNLPSSRISFGNFQRTLNITSVTEEDGGDYVCLAKNHFGSVNHTITVVIKAAPFWTSAPRNLILAPKETGMLSCHAGGNPKPIISWSINGVPIEDSPQDSNIKKEGNIITLSNVQSGSSAVYQCNASNEFGYLLANAFVSVIAEPPRVLTPPNKVYQVIANNPAMLDCATFGSPLPKITWFKDGQTLDGDSYAQHPNGTLQINEAQSNNSGKYICVATNNLGNKENSVHLEIKEPTQILEQPEYKVVQRNSKVVFECQVTHDPTLTPIMTWLKDNERLPDDERFVMSSDSLTINYVTEEDKGTYTCIRTTTLDQDSVSTTLTVVEVPDQPKDLELTDQSERSVQLTWIPGEDHNSPIKVFLVQYEDSLHEPGVWYNLTEASGSSTTAHLELSPYVYYSFRVLALNDVGLSEPSSSSGQYRTNPAQPDENPSVTEAIGTEPDNMVISWRELSGLQSNGPGLRYRVSWRRKDVDEDWTSVTVVNASEYTVSGTPTFVHYEVTVQAVNDYGVGPKPQVILGYSGEDTPMVAPEIVKVQVQTSTLAEVHWDPIPPNTINGRMLEYKVHYWKERSLQRGESQPEMLTVLTCSGNETQVKLDDLHPYSQYSVNVRAINVKGDGPASADQQFETPQGVPGPPTFLRITNPNVHTFRVEWGSPLHENGKLTGYLLRYEAINNTDEPKEISFPANKTSVTLENLKYSTRYRFNLNALTIQGSGPAISTMITIMDEALIRMPTVEAGTKPSIHAVSSITQSLHPPSHKVPSAFANMSYTVKEDHTVLNWEYSGAEKNVYVEYVLDNSKEAWKRESVNSSQTYQLKGLKAGMTYRVRMVAKDHTDATVHKTDELLIAVPAKTSTQVDIATQGWFIGLMCAIALLILVLLIICFIKRNKGGKYPVKEKEEAHQDPEIQPMKDDDGTFGEYSDTEDHKPLKGSRTLSNGTVKRDDSDDSLVDYGEGGDGQFNEDGSFIGQYSGKKEKDTAEGNESSEAPSPVNAMNSFV
ncbi:neuronal cell adhesion molecule a [Trichomycterus rosablanca]|uniref:neuronal cell adhesion molecule a n=1 Tax=Trichomycterus rosablanca TaxID=2290929 RepID=UPI002F353380